MNRRRGGSYNMGKHTEYRQASTAMQGLASAVRSAGHDRRNAHRA
jgi:hypothetical protein